MSHLSNTIQSYNNYEAFSDFYFINFSSLVIKKILILNRLGLSA